MKIYFIAAALALIFASSCNHANRNIRQSDLKPENFKTIVDGKQTDLYFITNSNGMEAAITNYGGRIVSLIVPDKEGKPTDVVLGHDSIQDYINIDGNFGAIIGRYGNRINLGRFTIDGNEYQLPQNNYGHCLHGGNKGFHHSVWDAWQPNDSSIQLSLQCRDGEAGFPGNLDVTVTYTLRHDNSLKIDYEATTDKPTIVNLTNHTYFNLSGDPNNTILDEYLTINASRFTPIDSTFMTTGEILPVTNTPFDFTQSHQIGERITSENEQLTNGLGYDHNYVLDTDCDITKCALKLHDNRSGITMETYTDQPGLQFYSGNFLDGKVAGKNNISYQPRTALCLETQHFPDSPNKPDWPSTKLNPDEKYHSCTIYRFSNN